MEDMSPFFWIICIIFEKGLQTFNGPGETRDRGRPGETGEDLEKLQLNITKFTHFSLKMAAFSLKTFRLFVKAQHS